MASLPLLSSLIAPLGTTGIIVLALIILHFRVNGRIDLVSREVKNLSILFGGKILEIEKDVSEGKKERKTCKDNRNRIENELYDKVNKNTDDITEAKTNVEWITKTMNGALRRD